MVNHYDVHVIFQDIEHQLQKNIFHHFFHYSFCEISIKLRSLFNPLKIIYWKLLRHCPTIQIISISNILISIKISYFTLVFFEAACHAKPGAARNFPGSGLYMLRLIFLKFSNTSANNNVSL